MYPPAHALKPSIPPTLAQYASWPMSGSFQRSHIAIRAFRLYRSMIAPTSFDLVCVVRRLPIEEAVIDVTRIVAEHRDEIYAGAVGPVDHPVEDVPERDGVRLVGEVGPVGEPGVVRDPNAKHVRLRVVGIARDLVVMEEISEVLAPQGIDARYAGNLPIGTRGEQGVPAPVRVRIGVPPQTGCDHCVDEGGLLVDPAELDDGAVDRQIRLVCIDEAWRANRLRNIDRYQDHVRAAQDDAGLYVRSATDRHVQEPVISVPDGRTRPDDDSVHTDVDPAIDARRGAENARGLPPGPNDTD